MKQIKDKTMAFAALFFERGAEILTSVSEIIKGEKSLKIKLESKSEEKGGENL